MREERQSGECREPQREELKSAPVLGSLFGPVLGIDSCGAETTLALVDWGFGGLPREVTLAARTAGSLLTGALRDLLDGLAPGALSAIVVVRGPGSFTGMRIGLSAAKALAEASAVPIVAVSCLAVLAGGARYAALDAGRGNVYLRHPAAEGVEEAMLTPDEARALLPDPGALVLCEEKVKALFPGARMAPAPTAAQAIEYARPRIEHADWDDAATLDALYLWRPEQMLGPRL